MLKRSPHLTSVSTLLIPTLFFFSENIPKKLEQFHLVYLPCLPLNSLSLFSLCGFKAEYRLMLESYLRVGKHFPPTSITDRFTLRLETPLSLRLRLSRETHQHLLSLWMRSWQEFLPKISLLLRFGSQISVIPVGIHKCM